MHFRLPRALNSVIDEAARGIRDYCCFLPWLAGRVAPLCFGAMGTKREQREPHESGADGEALKYAADVDKAVYLVKRERGKHEEDEHAKRSHEGIGCPSSLAECRKAAPEHKACSGEPCKHEHREQIMEMTVPGKLLQDER